MKDFGAGNSRAHGHASAAGTPRGIVFEEGCVPPSLCCVRENKMEMQPGTTLRGLTLGIFGSPGARSPAAPRIARVFQY